MDQYIEQEQGAAGRESGRRSWTNMDQEQEQGRKQSLREEKTRVGTAKDGKGVVLS